LKPKPKAFLDTLVLEGRTTGNAPPSNSVPAGIFGTRLQGEGRFWVWDGLLNESEKMECACPTLLEETKPTSPTESYRACPLS
jgi:hypothetical protein